MQEKIRPLAVVTGAASGIGRALALELDRRGYRLALCDIDEGGLQELGDQLEDAFGMPVDVGDQAAVEAFAAAVVSDLGTPEVVVHNAGVSMSEKFETMALQDFEWIMRINFWGMVYSCRAFLPAMLARKGGLQVFISSIFGVVGIPTQSAYNASKFAIRGFAEALRQEVQGRMDILVVCPGGVRTNIVRSGKIKDWPTEIPDGLDPTAAFDKAARLSAEDAGKGIADAIEARDQRLMLGTDAKLLDALQRLTPTGYPQASRRLLKLLS